MCFTCCLWLQHGINYPEEIPPLTLTGSKAAATLTVSERWLQQLEKQYLAEASTSGEAPPQSGSCWHLASGNAVMAWLCDWEPTLRCTQTLPGRTFGPRHFGLESSHACINCLKEHLFVLCGVKLSPACFLITMCLSRRVLVGPGNTGNIRNYDCFISREGWEHHQAHTGNTGRQFW